MTAPVKRGTLTIAGSGIASVAQMTLETVSHIKEADKVFYIVCDPVTEAFIQANAKGPYFDLSVFYDKEKDRFDSYIQMCEVMLRDVRAGHDVVGVFYGHPGVFVSPSHRALAIARREGFQARMLPGVSAEDYLFADLEFDPSIYGCVTVEATELLMRDKTLDTSVHNIIWQVGSVGISTMEFDNSKFHLLVDHLEKYFGADHKVVHYIGAVLPQSISMMDVHSIADLRKDEVVRKFNAISTLYVPPRSVAPVDATMAEGLATSGTVFQMRQMVQWNGPKLLSAPTYGPHERDVVAQIDTHVVPAHHKGLRASSGMKKFMIDLALSPELLERYKADPVAVVNGVEGLTDKEKYGLKFGKDGPIYSLMMATQSDIASGREPSEEEIDMTAGPASYATVVVVGVIVLIAS